MVRTACHTPHHSPGRRSRPTTQSVVDHDRHVAVLIRAAHLAPASSRSSRAPVRVAVVVVLSRRDQGHPAPSSVSSARSWWPLPWCGTLSTSMGPRPGPRRLGLPARRRRRAASGSPGLDEQHDRGVVGALPTRSFPGPPPARHLAHLPTSPYAGTRSGMPAPAAPLPRPPPAPSAGSRTRSPRSRPPRGRPARRGARPRGRRGSA